MKFSHNGIIHFFIKVFFSDFETIKLYDINVSSVIFTRFLVFCLIYFNRF